ncbi:MAG TPA: hypothetical protein VHO29_19825 [Marmoricola sp.]|nr:hypothetical protein [Marmoricola sp.]
MMGWNGGWWRFGMLGMGLFWVVVLGAIVWAVGRLTSRPEPTPPNAQETPRQVLDRRFASGELDEGQYLEARRVLDGGSNSTH